MRLSLYAWTLRQNCKIYTYALKRDKDGDAAICADAAIHGDASIHNQVTSYDNSKGGHHAEDKSGGSY